MMPLSMLALHLKGAQWRFLNWSRLLLFIARQVCRAIKPYRQACIALKSPMPVPPTRPYFHFKKKVQFGQFMSEAKKKTGGLESGRVSSSSPEVQLTLPLVHVPSTRMTHAKPADDVTCITTKCWNPVGMAWDRHLLCCCETHSPALRPLLFVDNLEE